MTISESVGATLGKTANLCPLTTKTFSKYGIHAFCHGVRRATFICPAPQIHRCVGNRHIELGIAHICRALPQHLPTSPNLVNQCHDRILLYATIGYMAY